MAVASSAHAGIQVVLAEEQLPLAAGELGSLVGMDQHLGPGLPPPDGRKQSLQSQVGRHAGLGGPSHHTPREEVDHDRQVLPAFVGTDLGDVGHPDLVRTIDLELSVQGVGRNHGRFAPGPLVDRLQSSLDVADLLQKLPARSRQRAQRLLVRG